MDRKASRILTLLFFLGALPVEVTPVGSTKVTIHLPIPQKIDLEGIQKVLVTDFFVEREDPTLDLGAELTEFLRRELRKHTSLQILDLDPPHLPEQAPEELLKNEAFWKELARTHGADLIISGGVEFNVLDRSGFVQETGISPTTGQRVRTTRFREREAYRLALDLFFIRGLTGGTLYENQFTEELLLDGKTSDHLGVLFNMMDRIRPEVLSVVAPAKRTEERVLLSY